MYTTDVEYAKFMYDNKYTVTLTSVPTTFTFTNHHPPLLLPLRHSQTAFISFCTVMKLPAVSWQAPLP